MPRVCRKCDASVDLNWTMVRAILRQSSHLSSHTYITSRQSYPSSVTETIAAMFQQVILDVV